MFLYNGKTGARSALVNVISEMEFSQRDKVLVKRAKSFVSITKKEGFFVEKGKVLEPLRKSLTLRKKCDKMAAPQELRCRPCKVSRLQQFLGGFQ